MRLPAFMALAKTCAEGQKDIFEVHSFRRYDGYSSVTVPSVSVCITRFANSSRTVHQMFFCNLSLISSKLRDR
jgi:hypothetical protein